MERVPLISTSDLTSENVPSPDNPKACRAFALTFDGYKYADGGPAELADLIETFPRNDEGFWDYKRITVDQARASLFWEQRATRWNVQGSSYADEEWGRFERHAVECVRLIRHKLFGEPAPE